MGLGKFTTPINAEATQGDASFAYGFGLSASFRVIAGLSVGMAPQIIYNVNYKENQAVGTAPPAVRETDLMARLAYTFPVVETIDLYVAVLPGYSTLQPARRHLGQRIRLGVRSWRRHGNHGPHLRQLSGPAISGAFSR